MRLGARVLFGPSLFLRSLSTCWRLGGRMACCFLLLAFALRWRVAANDDRLRVAMRLIAGGTFGGGRRPAVVGCAAVGCDWGAELLGGRFWYTGGRMRWRRNWGLGIRG
jgi:hypothetical protein